MDNSQRDEQQTEKIGVWRGSMLLARASWSTLKLDKELVAFPILTSIVNLILMGLIYYVIHLLGWNKSGSQEIDINVQSITGIVVLIATYLLLGFSTLYFSAAIVASALHRFQGGDPNLKYGLNQANKRFGSILLFSLLNTTVGVIVRILEDRASWLSKLFSAIIGIAWAVVSLFAIPVIVTSEKPLGPIGAIKGSVLVFKKVWANNFIGNFGIGMVAFLAFAIWVILAIAINFSVAIFINPALLFITAPITLIAFLILVSIFSALSSIFQAALYHYAVTGESPIQFDKNLLKAAFKPRKNSLA